MLIISLYKLYNSGNVDAGLCWYCGDRSAL